jgi:glycosyltransferase involved in cell wall biosynthesis
MLQDCTLCNGTMISIIIPAYNRADLIKETLNSIREQKYTEWECIVVDDSSTDNTVDVLKAFLAQDKRFKILKNTRKKGAQGARNSGFLEATGQYISFFDSDDLMHPEKLLKQIKFFNDNPDCEICTCYSNLMNDNNELIGAFKWKNSGNILKNLLNGTTYVDQNSALILKTALDRIGLLDEECPSFQEWDTHIRLAEVSEYGTVQELLATYYQRSSGRISTDTRRELLGLTYIYTKHRNLWKNVAGEEVYLSNIYSLLLKTQKKDKVFLKEIIKSLPELLDVPMRIKFQVTIKNNREFLKKLLRTVWKHFKLKN